MTPMITVLICGDEESLSLVLERLRRGLPVLVLPDTGGAAADLRSWLRDSTLVSNRGTAYEAAARGIIPQVLELGLVLGASGAPRLTFLELDSENLEAEEEVEFAIMQVPN